MGQWAILVLVLSAFKPALEKYLQPVAHVLRDVNPNALTIVGLIFPVLFFAALRYEVHWLALMVLALSGFDMLDGMVARGQGKVTAFGGFLDSTIDRFADFVIVAAFGYAALVSWEVVLPLLLLTYLISYMRSRTELAAKGKIAANVGIVERGERITLIFTALLIYTVFPTFTLFGGKNVLTLAFLLLIFLSLITIAQRFAFAYKKL